MQDRDADGPGQGQRGGGRNDLVKNPIRVVATLEPNVAECRVDPLHPSP